MKKQTDLQMAITFARARMQDGMNFDEASAATARYLFGNTECSAMYAQTVGLRAAGIVDAEINSQFLDLSMSTSDTIVLANPANGERSMVSMKVVIHALQCLARSHSRSTAATV